MSNIKKFFSQFLPSPAQTFHRFMLEQKNSIETLSSSVQNSDHRLSAMQESLKNMQRELEKIANQPANSPKEELALEKPFSNNDESINVLKNAKVVLFGVGEYHKEVLRYLFTRNIDVAYFVDNKTDVNAGGGFPMRFWIRKNYYLRIKSH